MQTDLFDQKEAQGPGERQTDLEDLIAETWLPWRWEAKYRCGEYQVYHVGNMEYEVVHMTTGNSWTWFQGRRLTNLSDAAACAQWHNKYDQEEI